ncbi:methyltransferase domain-containing protein, partial [Candidatus Sumerlaeota bacterium]|nr:methyltransferase domain-containing protein [Candidatus Sumerlaeota bacterium]
MPWDPATYLKFQSERFLPFDDLVKLIRPRDGLKVVDLGCGTGELTARLADLLPASEVLGMDSSPQMLNRAHKLERTGLRFEQRKIEEAEGRWDLIFSNAAIQWVDDHPALIARLFARLNPGGQIVIQLPSNQEHPTHRIILDLA